MTGLFLCTKVLIRVYGKEWPNKDQETHPGFWKSSFRGRCIFHYKKNSQGRKDYKTEGVSLLPSLGKAVVNQQQRSHLNLDAGMCRTYIQQLQPPDGRLCLLVKSALVSGHQLAEAAVDKLHHLSIMKYSITPLF